MIEKKIVFNNNVDENPFVGLIEYKKLPKNFFLRASFLVEKWTIPQNLQQLKI